MNTFKQKCDSAYELGEPIIADNEYEALFGENASAMTHPHSNEKKKIPIFMGSLDKVKDDKTLQVWLRKFKAAGVTSVVVSPKLDGVAALLSVGRDNGLVEMYSRGNGKEGSSLNKIISWIFDSQKLSVLNSNPSLERSYIRGELIMKKDVFKRKYSLNFKNARNMVAGQVSKKEPDNILSDIVFVPYEVINTTTLNNLPSTQLTFLYSTLCFDTGFVWKSLNIEEVTIASLSELYACWSKSVNYEIDGLVVAANIEYQNVGSGNPTTAFAFKLHSSLTEDSAIAKVVSVTWSISKWGAYKPVVNITPTKMKDVTISNLNGHNAAYICTNKLGKDALVRFIRSGKVIPYITEVLQPGSDIEVPEGIWKGTDIYTVVQDNDDNVLIKKLFHCLKTLQVMSIGLKTTEKLVTKCGYKTFLQLMKCTEQRLKTEFTPHTAYTIFKAIAELKTRPLLVSVLITASGILGQGISSAKAVMLLNTIDHTCVPKLSEVMTVSGFATKTATQVCDNFQNMLNFVEDCKQHGLQVIWDNEV